MTETPGRAPRRRRAEPPTDDVLFLMGQVLEAVQSASEGFRSSSVEASAQALKIDKMAKTLEGLEPEVRELRRIVLEGDSKDPALRYRVAALAEQIHTGARALEDLSDQLATYDRRHNQAVGAGQVLVYVAIALFQLATLGIAVYGALRRS